MGRFAVVLVCLACLLTAAVALAGCARGEFVGSKISNKYHDPECVWAEEMKRENRVWFETADDAQAAGYEPCPNCLPAQ